jgi:hypothetical protein
MYKIFIKTISFILLLFIIGCSGGGGGGAVIINPTVDTNDTKEDMNIYNPPSGNVTIDGVSTPPSIGG